MSLTNVTSSTEAKKKFSRIEDGTYVARVVQIIDLGVQEDEYEGQKKIGPKVFINFEFPTELMEDNENKPHWLGKEFTVSLHEKAVMTKLVAAADPDGKATSKGRNLKGLLGLPLMVTVGTTGTGNAKIAGVARLMKGLSVADLSKDPLFFDMDSATKEEYDVLPQWIREKILVSRDFDDVPLAKLIKGSTSESAYPVADMEDSPY